jgi:AraC-like DNA-binding protein
MAASHMSASTYAATGRRPADDAGPATGASPWELWALRHQRLPSGTPLAKAPGPLWALVLDGSVMLETSSGAKHLRAGDAVLVDGRTAFRLTATAEAELAVADLRLVVPPSPIPSPVIVRDFARRHHGVAELVRTCPLGAKCRPSVFAASYGGLIGASMVAAWLEDQGGPQTEPSPADPAVAVVVAAIADRPADPWTGERMARLVHLSRSALRERFRRELGRSPATVLREIRMQRARGLLADHSRPVGQIGHAVGYGSAAAFSRAFSAHHGMAPQVWRVVSTAGQAEQGEAETTHGRGRRADQQRDADPVRVDDLPTDGCAERDGHLERRRL